MSVGVYRLCRHKSSEIAAGFGRTRIPRNLSYNSHLPGVQQENTQIRDLKASNTLSPSVISCGGHISPGGHSSTSQVTPTSPRPFGSLQRPAGCAGDAAVLSERGYTGSAVLRASSWSHPAVGRRHRFVQVWARARSLYVDVGKAAVP